MQQSILFAITLLALLAFTNSISAEDQQSQRQSEPSSVEVQLDRCSAPQSIADLSNMRLILAWFSADPPRDPVEYLRNILTDDLQLPQLAFAINRVRVLPNQMIFDMSSSLSTHFVFRNYCKLFAQISKYRSLGYDEPALPYEILKTDLSFYDYEW